MSNKNDQIAGFLEKNPAVWNIKNETPLVKIKQERVSYEPRLTINKIIQKFFN